MTLCFKLLFLTYFVIYGMIRLNLQKKLKISYFCAETFKRKAMGTRLEQGRDSSPCDGLLTVYISVYTFSAE